MCRDRLIGTTGLDDALVKNDLWGMCSFGAHDWLSLTVMYPSSGQVYRLNLALLYLIPISYTKLDYAAQVLILHCTY